MTTGHKSITSALGTVSKSQSAADAQVITCTLLHDNGDQAGVQNAPAPSAADVQAGTATSAKFYFDGLDPGYSYKVSVAAMGTDGQPTAAPIVSDVFTVDTDKLVVTVTGVTVG